MKLFIAPILALALCSALPAQAGGALVRNAKAPAAALEKAALKKLYSGHTATWSDGTEVKLVLNAAGTKELAWVTAELLALPEKVVLAKIRLEVFNGTISRPPSVATSAECLDEVKKSPVAICAVDEATAAALPAGVELLKVTGGD